MLFLSVYLLQTRTCSLEVIYNVFSIGIFHSEEINLIESYGHYSKVAVILQELLHPIFVNLCI